MNNLISLEVRIIATAIHFIFALLMECMFLVLSEDYDPTAKFPREIGTATINFMFGGYMLILAWILSICEKRLGTIHPFIKINCRDVIDYTLNSFLVVGLLFLSVFFSMLIGSIFSGESGFIFFTISVIIVNIVQAFYFVNSVISAIYAFRGYRFKNRFIRSSFEDD